MPRLNCSPFGDPYGLDIDSRSDFATDEPESEPLDYPFRPYADTYPFALCRILSVQVQAPRSPLSLTAQRVVILAELRRRQDPKPRPKPKRKYVLSEAGRAKLRAGVLGKPRRGGVRHDREAVAALLDRFRQDPVRVCVELGLCEEASLLNGDV